ncbi:MAG: DUF1998 domain-containing protein [Candidatus Aenigmarchaeota archaeon]|nr:DUF1998 domain-containing protein [Candidatus Aenigmarchaeota archaeon]
MKFEDRVPRGKSQVLFNFLPGALIDFPTTNIVAKVAAWQSDKIESKSNKRILDKIYSLMTEKYMAVDDRFPKKPDVSQFRFGEPILVESEIFPLVFKSQTTKKVYFFYNLDDLDRFLASWNKSEQLVQIDLIFIDTHGDVDRLHPTQDARKKNIKLEKIGKSQAGLHWIDMDTDEDLGQIWHFMNGKRISVATPVRAKITYLPQIITLVNIRDYLDFEQREKEILMIAIISKYLDHLNEFSDMTFDKIVREVRYTREMGSNDIEKLLAKLGVDKNNLPDDKKKEIVKFSQSSGNIGSRIKAVLDQDKEFIRGLDVANIYDRVYEYLTTIESRGRENLDEAIDSALQDKSKFIQFKKRMDLIGVKKITYVEDIPIQNVAYGYVRGSFNTKETILRAFPFDRFDNKRIPIYLTNTTTEGLVLELDRTKILKWLNNNGIVETKNMSDEEEKLWFLNNIDSSKISTFSGTKEAGVTREVFHLIHSISHALIKKIPEQAGIGLDSIGEIIFPNIPAILIFSRESGDFRIGALHDLFRNRLYPWVDVTIKDIGKCVYDPVCYHDIGSCHSCLYLNEISCSNFNQDLSRHYLIGKAFNGNLSAFWKDAINQIDRGVL